MDRHYAKIVHPIITTMDSYLLCLQTLRSRYGNLFARYAFLFLIIYLLYSQTVLVNHIRLLLPKRQQDIGIGYEKRLSPLRVCLPDHGVVGYASDTGNEHFLRAQYVLSPVVLHRSGNYSLIVANYSRASARPGRIYGNAYRVLKDFNNGVALLAVKK